MKTVRPSSLTLTAWIVWLASLSFFVGCSQSVEPVGGPAGDSIGDANAANATTNTSEDVAASATDPENAQARPFDLTPFTRPSTAFQPAGSEREWRSLLPDSVKDVEVEELSLEEWGLPAKLKSLSGIQAKKSYRGVNVFGFIDGVEVNFVVEPGRMNMAEHARFRLSSAAAARDEMTIERLDEDALVIKSDNIIFPWYSVYMNVTAGEFAYKLLSENVRDQSPDGVQVMLALALTFESTHSVGDLARELKVRGIEAKEHENDAGEIEGRQISMQYCRLWDGDVKYLSQVQNVKRLKLDFVYRGGFTHKGMKQLANLTELQELELYHCDINDAAMESLQEFPHLKKLSLVHCAVHGEGLLYLSELGQLEEVSFYGCPLNGTHLDVFSTDTLQKLDLAGTLVTDADLGKLGKYEKLRVLSLGSLPLHYNGDLLITGQGLGQLENCPLLEELHIVESRITDRTLPNLPAFPKLTSLSVAKADIQGKSLKHLSQYSKLKELDLSGCPLRDEELVHLTGLEKLETLYLMDTSVTGDCLVHLAELPNLKTLYLSGTALTNENLKSLHDFPSLTTLWLPDDFGNSRYKKEDLDALRAALPNCNIQLL